MAKSTRVTRPTASDVRAFYVAHPERASKFNEHVQHVITPGSGARGQLPQVVIDDYNKGVKPDRQYVRGQGLAVKADRKAVRADLIAKGLAGKRGPLSKEAQEALVSK